jgi:hypothetical protein
VAVKHGTTPRGVYEGHWAEMDELLQLPGRARRSSLTAPIEIPAPAHDDRDVIHASPQKLP